MSQTKVQKLFVWGGSPAGHYFTLGTHEGEAKVKGDYVLVLNGDRESVHLLRSSKRQRLFSVITSVNILLHSRCSCTGQPEELQCPSRVKPEGAKTASVKGPLSPLCTISHLSPVFLTVCTLPGLRATQLCLESIQSLR